FVRRAQAARSRAGHEQAGDRRIPAEKIAAGRNGIRIQPLPGTRGHAITLASQVCLDQIMSDIEQTPRPQQPPPMAAVSNSNLAVVVYILYFLAYFTGITAIAGVIVAYVQFGSADAMLQTHYRFQIRTFWIGLLYLVVGTVLAM